METGKGPDRRGTQTERAAAGTFGGSARSSLHHKTIFGFQCHLFPKSLNGLDDNQRIFQLYYDNLKPYKSSLLLPLCREQVKNNFKN